jgi:hypothetical protein
VTFLNALRDQSVIISYKEVASVTFIAIIFGIIITISSTYKLHFRIVHKLKITKKFGELDVWGFTFNSPQINWATVRDHKNNLVYDGWVQAFSDDSKDAEIFLRDVSIYKNDSGEKLYQVGALYFSRERSDITIEFRDIPVAVDLKWKEETINERSRRRK